MSQENVDTVHRLLSLDINGDVEGVFVTIDPECIIHEAESLPWGGEWRGPSGFAEMVGVIAAHVTATVHRYEIYDAGETIFSRMEVTFVSKSSVEAASMPVIEMYTFRKGKFVDIDVFYKDAGAVNALCRPPA